MRAVLSKFSGSVLRKTMAGAMLSLVAATVFSASATYTYDSLSRISKITYSNGVVITYTYDATGNRTAYVVTGAPS